jgi:hypothetical protein
MRGAFDLRGLEDRERSRGAMEVKQARQWTGTEQVAELVKPVCRACRIAACEKMDGAAVGSSEADHDPSHGPLLRRRSGLGHVASAAAKCRIPSENRHR